MEDNKPEIVIKPWLEWNDIAIQYGARPRE